MKTLGETIREAREAKGLSLRRLAHKVGVSAPFLCDVEHDRRRPARERLEIFSKVLGIELIALEKVDPRTIEDRVARLEQVVKVLWNNRELLL